MKSLRDIWDGLRDSHVVDHTRLRLDDGTPLHAGKLRRIFSNTANKIGVIVTLSLPAVVIASGDKWGALLNLVGGTLGLGLGRAYCQWNQDKILTETFGPKHERFCFNTNPENPPEKSIVLTAALQARKDLYFMVAHFSLLSGAVLYSAFGPSSGFLQAFFFYSFVDKYLSLNRFLHVVKSEWIIEEAPPPKKVPEKERVPVLERLNRLLPAPRPAI